MESAIALKRLSALAQESRLAVFRLLVRAGARVNCFTDIKEVTGLCPTSDAMLLDYCDSSLHLAMPMLSRLATTCCFCNVPKMLLARQTENPQSRVDQAQLPLTAVSTPIRSVSLLKSVRKLMD